MAFFKVCANLLYGVHNPVGVKYITRLRVGLSHLRSHKVDDNFRDTTHDVHGDVIKFNLLNTTISYIAQTILLQD